MPAGDPKPISHLARDLREHGFVFPFSHATLRARVIERAISGTWAKPIGPQRSIWVYDPARLDDIAAQLSDDLKPAA